MKEGEEIRFVVNRMHDGQPLAEKIRSAWEGNLEDAYRGYVANAGRHRLVGSCWMGRHDRRAARAKLRPRRPDFQEEAAEAGRSTIVAPCIADTRPRSIAGLRSLNAIISTGGLRGPLSTSHGPN